MFDTLRSFLDFRKASRAAKQGGWAETVSAAAAQPAKGKGTSKGAAGQLPPQTPPKVRPKQQSYPGYVTTTAATTAAILKPDLQSANQDLVATYRLGADTPTVIRNLAKVNPDLATAVSAYLRVGIPEKHIAIARDGAGNFNLQGTALALEVLRRWANMPNYETGFSQTDSLRSVSEALAKEGILYGGMGLELVLDKTRLPSELAPIPVTQLRFYPDDKGLRPVQVVGGEEVDLDIPTFFYVALDPSLLNPYPESPMESAIQPVLASSQFLNDLRKLCNRHVYPRYDISIDEEKLRKNIPPEILADPDQTADYINGIFADVEQMVNDLGVEEALVHFDFITAEFLGGQSGDVPNTFETVQNIFESKIATGTRTLPAILGHGSGSQNVASTETMLFMLSANSMVRIKLQELYSRALTLAVRLFGLDVTVEFEFDDIELRPASELEAFYTMKQERLLNQLSLGLITDEECCLRLTGQLPPVGYTPKMGTGFQVASSGAGQRNAYSGTGAGGGQSGGGASNQSQKSTAPANSKGPAK